MVYYFTKKRSIVLCVLFFLYCNVALFFLLCESQFLTKYSSVRYHIMKVSRYFALDTKTEFRKGYCGIRISSLCAMLYMNYPRSGDCAFSASFVRECTDVSYVAGEGVELTLYK